MLHFAVGRALSPLKRHELEQQLERRLGPVTCVRHPPAIDGVSISGDREGTSIAVSACCELTSRRAKILVAQTLAEVLGEREKTRTPGT